LSSGDLSKIETGAKPPTEWGIGGDKVEAVDVVAFVVDADEQVGEDSDFCFYNNLAHPTGAVDLALETPGEALLQARLNLLPEGRARIVVAAALEGDATFGDLGPIELVLATVYNRNGAWRLRAVGQGYESGLASLAVLHGVDIDDWCAR